MKCLIIAAGEGSRLSKLGSPKPLVPLLGLRLIERVILTINSAGITNFYVVVGYQGNKVKEFLEKFGEERNINITCIFNDEWRKGNGVSVWKAKDFMKETFILSMSDHIYNAEIVKGLVNYGLKEDGVILAVDKKLSNPFVDIDDVTKVLVEDNLIVNIGKNIDEFNAYDTGVFLCSTAIFSVLEESIKDGDYSLSGGIRKVAKRGKVFAFDIGDSFWIDVDSEKMYKKAEKYLLKSLLKVSDGPVSRHLNRPISLFITKYLVKKKITPNEISLLSFFLSIAGALLFAVGSYFSIIAGGILAQLSSIIDGCDGEVARLKFISSDFGGWFDAVLDRYADGALLLGLTYALYIKHMSFGYVFLGFLAIIGTFMNSYTADKYDGFMKRHIVNKKGYFRLGRDVRLFIIFVGAIFNAPFAVLVVIASVMNAENIRRILLLWKQEQLSVRKER